MKDTRVLWFTGLSGSGKSTVADRLSRELEKAGKTVAILDGDAIRSSIHKALKFTPEDIRENNRLIAFKCQALLGQYDFIIVSVISPFRESRLMARKALAPHFTEVYIKADLEECIRRDVKGIYRLALAGRIENFIGISPATPYEAPPDPDLTLDTQRGTVEACVKIVTDYLNDQRLLNTASESGASCQETRTKPF